MQAEVIGLQPWETFGTKVTYQVEAGNDHVVTFHEMVKSTSPEYARIDAFRLHDLVDIGMTVVGRNNVAPPE